MSFDPTTVDVQFVWEKSSSLVRARQIYGKHYFGDNWSEAESDAKSRHPYQAFQEAAENAQEQGIGFMEALNIGLGKTAEVTKPFEGMCRQVEAKIRQNAQSGILIATAYDHNRQLTSLPVFVPKDMWNGHVDWNSNTIKKGKLKAVEARLIPASLLAQPKKTPKAHDALPEAKKSGRPGFEDVIKSAIMNLHEAGKIDLTKSRSWHFALIKNELECPNYQLEKNPQDISNETIRKYFSPFFNKLKESNKQ